MGRSGALECTSALHLSAAYGQSLICGRLVDHVRGNHVSRPVASTALSELPEEDSRQLH